MDEVVHHCLKELAFDGDLGEFLSCLVFGFGLCVRKEINGEEIGELVKSDVGKDDH